MKEAVQKLREKTGGGVMECKRALEEAGGDFEKAEKIIEAKGIARAEKKGERKTGAGHIETYVHAGRIGVLLEMRCETDFVARSDQFRFLAHEIAMQVAAMAPETPEALLKQQHIKDPAISIENLVKKDIAVLGENIKIEKFCRYEV